MTIDIEDLMNSINESFSKMKTIKPDEIPNIDLYMDQVTTFLDERLKSSTRDKYSDEKVLTKTMINNYAKSDALPSPVKKKYNKEHILLLTLLFYYKSFLQINDIETLLKPIIDTFFGNENYNIEDVYNGIFDGMSDKLQDVLDDVNNKCDEALNTFKDAPGKEQDYLHLFYFACSLGVDVFVKKLLIEKIVDSIREHKEADGNKYDVSRKK